MSALKSALALAKIGLHVHPVQPQSKKPLLTGWPDLATTDPATIERWFTDHPAANIGVVPGKSGHGTLDIDPRNGGRETMDAFLREYGTDSTSTVTTNTGGGGKHLYFDMGGQSFHDRKIGPGVEVKINGYVLTPQSVHPNGEVYEWERGCSPFDRNFLTVPDWLTAHLITASQKRNEMNAGEIGLEMMQVRDIPKGGYTLLASIPTSHRYTLLASNPRPPLSDGRLREIATDEMLMRYVGTYLGIRDVSLGTPVLCVLHAESNPSAALYPDRNGVVMYHDFHAQGTRLEWLTLAEVYAAQKTGEIRKLNAPEHATWFIRLLVDAGLIDPAPLPMVPLPPGASSSMRKVYEGIKLLFGCKWLYAPEEPSALSWRFTAGWCGVAPGTAASALKMLVARNIVAPVGQHPAAYGKTMATYLPVGSER